MVLQKSLAKTNKTVSDRRLQPGDLAKLCDGDSELSLFLGLSASLHVPQDLRRGILGREQEA
jgi:hypothetical protein